MKFIVFKFMFLFILLLTHSQKSAKAGTSSYMGPQDLTLIPGSSGEAVVDACIQRISSFPKVGNLLKNDFGFMKRIALVETNFGQSSGYDLKRGIWQISPFIQDTLIHFFSSEIQDITDAIAHGASSDMVDFLNNDFSTPLRSAVAARIFLEILFDQKNNFPGTIPDQAFWWAYNYQTNGDEKMFKTIVENFENAHRCRVSKLDLWFLVDGSGSIGETNFQNSLNFVDQTAANFTIGPDGVRTGLAIYSSNIIIRSHLNEHQTNSEFSEIVLSTTYPSGGTQTGEAIRSVYRQGFNTSGGVRLNYKGVPRILIVLTDGESGDSVIKPSQEVKAAGVTVFGVGIGSGFVESEINEIASDPDSTYAFEFSQFDALSAILRDRVATQACEVPAVVPENISLPLHVDSNSTYYSSVEMPSNKSMELKYEIRNTSSVGKLYLSEFITNPNPAFFDAFYELHEGLTKIYYQSKKSANESSTLYVAFVTVGNEPINMIYTVTPKEISAVERSFNVINSATTTELNLILVSAFVCIFETNRILR